MSHRIALPAVHDAAALSRLDVSALKKLITMIRAGFGQGHGPHYKSWLQLTRSNSSPCSTEVTKWMPTVQRSCHYMAHSEYRLALLLYWLGFLDVREQYPLWPWCHPHPLSDHPTNLFKYSPCVGHMDIAAMAGIDHGEVVGTHVPYIATIDLMGTRCSAHGELSLHAFACKPTPNAHRELPLRVLERLELGRRYCKVNKMPHSVVASSVVSHQLAGTLGVWCGSSHLASLAFNEVQLQEFVDTVSLRLDWAQIDVLHFVVNHFKIPIGLATRVLHHCFWHGLIDADPLVPNAASLPIPLGGCCRREAICAELLEGCAS